MTHNQDPVVRLPSNLPLYPYTHSHTEMFEDGVGNVKKCNSTGEDMTCAMQFMSPNNNFLDHLYYLGCAITICGVVCDPAFASWADWSVSEDPMFL